MKKLCFLLLVLGLGSNSFGKFQAHQQSDSFTIGSKRVVKSVRKLLKDGVLNKKETCLDEYLNRHKQLVKMASFGTLGGIAGTATTTAAGVGVGVTAGGLISGSAGALTLGIVGGTALGGVGAAAFVGYEAYAIAQLIQNKYLIKVISNARDGEGKSLKRFTKSLNRKMKDLNASQSLVANMIVEADKNGTLCDGSIVRKGKKKRLTKIRHYLANKREIIKHLGKTL